VADKEDLGDPSLVDYDVRWSVAGRAGAVDDGDVAQDEAVERAFADVPRRASVRVKLIRLNCVLRYDIAFHTSMLEARKTGVTGAAYFP
jgi:hypothetical protein